jgi:hypothetical protein
MSFFDEDEDDRPRRRRPNPSARARQRFFMLLALGFGIAMITAFVYVIVGSVQDPSVARTSPNTFHIYDPNNHPEKFINRTCVTVDMKVRQVAYRGRQLLRYGRGVRMKYYIAATICSVLLSLGLHQVATGAVYWIAYLAGCVYLYHLASRDAKAAKIGAE